ncbi:MAG TPA: adenylate kinase [Candidatus Omnitrophota bacterium]|nr:adenylate kinase [Candidatus Omnitrophota bacterium]HPS36170.1 adenylate kinase [Candidatus Omnitrophota bacterium]
MNLIFLGPPGAGKGTHAQMLCKGLQLAHLAAGDILRKNVKEGTPLGVEAKGVMERGELVSDDLVNKMMFDAIGSLKGFKGFVLDGYPRTIGQAEALEKFLIERAQPLTAVINFDASEQVVVDRLSGRRGCPKCGKIYHVRNMPPKSEGVCDVDGEKLTTRKDDEPETIRRRLKVYHESTKPLIDFYRKRRLLRDVPADGDAPSVQKTLEKLFEKIRKTA